MRTDKDWGLLGQGLAVLALTAALAACGGSSDASDVSSSGGGSAASGASVAGVSPSVTGTPSTTVVADNRYSFLPTVANPTGTPLSFSIQQKPVWASFAVTTGELSGTPSAADEGEYPNIVISASDGTNTSALPAFSIQVTAAGTSSSSSSSGAGSSLSSSSAAGSSSSSSSGAGSSSGATASAAPQLISPAFYVSPSGSDGNNGESASTPFLTLEKAQAAMQVSSVKTNYLLGGVYARTATLNLGQNDSGESWLGYPGQTPVLDGADTVNTAISIFKGNDISIRWITIQNFALNGISANAVSGVLIDSNTIKNIQSNAWAQGAMVLAGYTNGRVSHNVIQNVQYDGILAASWEGNTITNLVIEDNVVYDTCISIADCGGIYAVDLAHTSTGIVINNNVVSNYGTSTNASKAIYLDDELSNATVENNIVRGTGTYAFQIHGGDHNVLRNNIFDISGAVTLSLYQASVASNPNYGMSDNAFTCNIVYSSNTPPSSLWVYIVQPIDAPPAVNNNLYWDASAALPNTGSVVDALPTVANPDFVNPSQANYAFGSTLPSFCVFAPIDTSQVGPVPNP